MKNITNTLPAYVRYFCLLMVLISFVIGLAFFFGYFLAFTKLQKIWLFPSDTIYGQGSTLGKFLAFFPPALPFMFLGMLILQFVVSKIHFARKISEQKGDYHTSQRMLWRIIRGSFAVCIPLAIVGFFNYVYITDSKIVCRGPLLVASRYSWDDVQAIESTLSIKMDEGSPYVTLKYTFYMHNGTTVKLNPGIFKFFNFYPALYDVINNHPEIARTSNITVSKNKISTILNPHETDLVFKMANFQSP